MKRKTSNAHPENWMGVRVLKEMSDLSMIDLTWELMAKAAYAKMELS